MRWEISTPITAYLVYRSYSHASLTPAGILTAAVTATIHALHPSPLPFTLLVLFFLLGTTATKVKKEVKATLTLSSTGSHPRNSAGGTRPSNVLGTIFSGDWNKTSEYHEKREAAKKASNTAGGQEPRSAVQVLANSGVVSLLCLLHIYLYGLDDKRDTTAAACFGSLPARDVILAGIVANYASVTADTLSSELGILSPRRPWLILNLREVPPGTNGGITGAGLGAGLAGALVIGLVSVLFLPSQCSGGLQDTLGLVLGIGVWGALGSVLDSVLGATLQASVVDRRSEKVVEAPNGGRVLVMAKKEKDEADGGSGGGKPSRMIGSGRDILDNNQVNFAMAGVMSVGAMGLAGWVWGVPLRAVWTK